MEIILLFMYTRIYQTIINKKYIPVKTSKKKKVKSDMRYTVETYKLIIVMIIIASRV